jgi:ferric-dicitrate binding protein FerR (iron transport regulator)
VTAVAAGQEARVARSGSVQFEPHADVATSVAWLQRKLVFRGTLLEDMVLEVNRYNRGVQLHVENVTAGRYRFSGTFDANDPLSLADTLGREAGLSVERRGNDIYIRESTPTP